MTRMVAVNAPLPPLDPRAFGELRALGSREFLVDLIDTFLRETEERLSDLRQARQAGRTDLLLKAAHTLKGSSGNMGAMALSGLCRRLEEEARKGGGGDEAALLAQIEAEVLRVREALAAERAR